ncbi:DUF4129 domain-containing protein [Metabacillus niabensis]|uniref:DUF4129 domain-containing protein n=1 Tax=Metabacillus niabensis TaxID=324854 RepID=UPI0039A32CA3
MLNEDKARNELENILNSREYKVYEEKPKNIFEQWWNDLNEWFIDFLNSMFPSIEPSKDYSETILMMNIVITILLLLLLVTLLIRNRNRKKSFHLHKPLQSINEIDWTYQMHLSEALKQEGQKEYKLSTRHLFLALLLYFHEREWLVARIWKTNWEYYDELKSVNQKWAEQFYHLALIFDEATYGEKSITKEEYERFKKEAMKWLGDNREEKKNG